MAADEGSNHGKPPAPPPAPPAEKSRDVVFVQGPAESGRGVSIVRVKDEQVSVGEMVAAKEGQPITGELVKLSPRPEHERLFDVEVLAKPPEPAAPTHKGPPRIATDAYRAGWEQVFGKRTPPGELN